MTIKICRLGVLGVRDIARDDSAAMHHDFKDQLRRNKDSYYEE